MRVSFLRFYLFLPLGKSWLMAMIMLLAGSCMALALPPVNIIGVLPFSLVILYYAAGYAPTWRKAALWAFLFGMGFHTAGLYWLTNAILTRVHEFWWVVPFAAPGVALIIAPLIIIPALLCRLVEEGWGRIAIFAGSWVLADMTRVWFFSGFPWNPLGSALAFSSVPWGDIALQPASLIGVDGLSLVLIFAALALWRGWRGVVFVLLLLGLWAGFGFWRLSAPPERVWPQNLERPNPALILVQGNVTEDEVVGRQNALARFAFYLHATEAGVKQAKARNFTAPLVVVWPESAFPGLLMEDERARSLIAQAAQGARVFVGSPRRVEKATGTAEIKEEWYNSLAALGPDGQIEALYDKSRLVPFGEYQPSILPFNILPAVYNFGPGLRTWDSPAFGRVGPMICYEIIFSGAVTEPHNRPNWLLTISNDAWYGNSAGPYQHLATGRMRAVEEGLPVAFVNNRGVSAVYDGLGRQIARTKWGREQTLIVQLPPPEELTVFAEWGRGIPALLSLFLIIYGAYSGGFYRKEGRFI